MNPIPVIYTVGKVGSSSYADAIRAAKLPCLDIHSLDHDKLLRIGNDRLKTSPWMYRHVIEALGWREIILSNPERFTFITAVRDPIEVALSAIFQNLDLFKMDHVDSARLSDIFRNRYPLDTLQTWFNREIQGCLGIDVLDLEYDPSLTWRQGNLLILRSDLNDRRKGAAISKHVNRRVEIGRKNVSAGKDYADAYQAIRQRARFDAEALDAIYGMEFCKVFWSPEELSSLRARWST